MMRFRPERRSGRELWKYALQAVRFLLEQQRTGVERPTASPLEYIFWKEDFTTGYLEARCTAFPSLSSVFKSALLSTPTEVLHLWISDLVQAEVQAASQAQSQGVTAWLRSWWSSEPVQAPSPDSLPSPRSQRDWKWLEVRLTINETELEVAQTRLQVGSQWEGFRVWAEQVQLHITASSKALQSQLKVNRLGAVLWTDQRSGRDSWDCLSSQESPHLAIDLAWGSQDDFEVACTLRGSEVRYRKELLAHLVALWSQTDLAPRESVSAWETVALLRSAGQSTWKRVAEKARKRLSLRANRLKLTVALTPDEAIQASIGTLAFDLPEDPVLKKSLKLSSVSLTSQSASGEETLLSGLSLKVLAEGETCRNIIVESSDFELHCGHCLYHKVKDYLTSSSLPPTLSIAREYEKRVILKAAIKSDLMETSADTVLWEPLFTVLSGPYLYFFNSPKDWAAASYFYLTNAHLKSEELQLSVVTDSADCYFRCKSTSQLEDWSTSLQTHINSLSKTGLILSPQKKSPGKSKVTVTFWSPKAAVVLQDTSLQLAVRLEVLDLTVTGNRGVTWSSLVLTEERTAQALVALPSPEQIQLTKGPNCLHFSQILVHWHLYTFRSLWNFLQLRPYETESSISPRQAPDFAGVTVSCSLLDLYCVNQVNGFLLAHLQAKDFSCSVGPAEGGGKRIALSIPTLRTEDLTDYPRTMLKRPATEPLVLVQGDIAMEIVLRPDINEKLQGNFLTLQSQSLSLVHMNQPLLRLWNYIQTKLLGLFDKE